MTMTVAAAAGAANKDASLSRNPLGGCRRRRQRQRHLDGILFWGLSFGMVSLVQSSTLTLSLSHVPWVHGKCNSGGGGVLSSSSSSSSLAILCLRGGSAASDAAAASSSTTTTTTTRNSWFRPKSSTTRTSPPPPPPPPASYRYRPPFNLSQQQQQQQQQHSTTTTTSKPVVQDITHASNDAQEREATKDVIDAFLTRDSRVTFIARVYAILTGQLFVTTLSIFFFASHPAVSQWVGHRMGLVCGLSLLLSTVAWITMCLSETARRSSPLKWQLLGLFTLGEAVSVGFISSLYAFRTVVSAMLATGTATLAITLYTLLQRNPKYDLSQWGAGLSSCGMIFLMYGLMNLLEILGILPSGFLPFSDVMYALLGACLFSFYLAYHSRLIVSGKHTKYQMNDKDYVFGAMALYNDVINIFLYLLRVLGGDAD